MTIIDHFLSVIFLFILFSLSYLFIYYFYHFLIYLLIYLFIQLFNFKNLMFLQGNLPLEFKESGTLRGRFLEGNLKLRRWLLKGKIEKKKEEKKKGNRRIFLFGNKFRSWRVIHIYRRKDGGKAIRRIFCGEAQRKQEKSNCNQGCPGILLVTLGILTHFFCVFVYEYSYIVDWCGRKGTQNCCVEVGSWYLLYSHSHFVLLDSLADSKTSYVLVWMPRSLTCLFAEFDRFDFSSPFWAAGFILESGVCWSNIFFLYLPHLFKARWFEIWNVALPSSVLILFYFIFSFLSSSPLVLCFRLPFSLSDACLWDSSKNCWSGGFELGRMRQKEDAGLLCEFICWNRE